MAKIRVWLAVQDIVIVKETELVSGMVRLELLLEDGSPWEILVNPYEEDAAIALLDSVRVLLA